MRSNLNNCLNSKSNNKCSWLKNLERKKTWKEKWKKMNNIWMMMNIEAFD